MMVVYDGYCMKVYGGVWWLWWLWWCMVVVGGVWW